MRIHPLLLVSTLALLPVLHAVSTDEEGVTKGELPSAVSGCDLVRVADHSICHFSVPATGPASHELVLWIEDEVIDPEVRLVTPSGVHAFADSAKRIGSGTQVVVQVEQQGVLEIRGATEPTRGGPSRSRRWTLEIEPRPPTPELDALQAQWDAPSSASALDSLLDPLQSIGDTADPWQAARAWDLRGEILLRTVDADAALEAYERAIVAAGPDELSLRCRLLRKIGHLHLVDREDVRATEATFARMSECEELDLSHHHLQAFNLGELRLLRNDYRGAIGPLRMAVAGASRLRLPRLGMSAAALLAETFARIQRFDAAAAAMREARDFTRERGPDCESDAALAARAATIALEQGSDDSGPLRALVDTLLAECTRSGAVQSNTLLTIAYVEQVWHHDEEAERWLDQLDEHSITPMQQMYEASIRADIAMDRDDWPEAAGAVAELATLLEQHPREAVPELVVQRELVTARVAQSRGDLVAAKTHLRQAIALQNDLLRLVPLGLSVSRVSAKQADAARYLVELQRQENDLEGALCTARLLRNREARVLFDAARLAAVGYERYERLEKDVATKEAAFVEALRSGSPADLVRAKDVHEAAKDTLIDALAGASGFADHDPERLCDALPAPAEDELELLFHQDPRGRWWLFDWTRAHSVRIRGIGLGDPTSTDDPRSQVERLLGPVSDRLADVSRVRVLASGAIHRVVFEKLPWKEGTLEESFFVTWGQDLPRRPDLDHGPEGVPRPVVVITDPRDEFTARAPQIGELLAAVERVWGPLEPRILRDDTTTIADLRTLAGGALLVLIGHNTALHELDPLEVDNPECLAGLPSQAPRLVERPEHDPRTELPPRGIWINSTSFDLDTILTFDPPRVAILESCATGPADEPSLAGAVGLGHALVAAGTQQVLVTRKVVCPTQALAFATALIEAAGHDEEQIDLPRLVRAARHEDPEYLHRVLVP
jgi:tetratricopeptide (TPR) repeat protein